MNPTSSPKPGFGHRMVYDARSDRIILFGGLSEVPHVHFDQTWAYDFDTNAWTQLSPSTKPGVGEVWFALAYDAESDRVILFGNNDQTYAYDFNTNAWTIMNPAARPPALYRPGDMPYDAGSDRVILVTDNLTFEADTAGQGVSQTWAYDFNENEWTKMNLVVHPSGRRGHRMAYDQGSDRVVLFGGADGGTYLFDTWAYNFNTDTWTPVH